MAMAWAVVERAMKMQEVIVRALAGQLTWRQAADIVGIDPRSLAGGARGTTRRGCTGGRHRPSCRKAPLQDIERIARLYREQYAGFNARHFHPPLGAGEESLNHWYLEGRALRIPYSPHPLDHGHLYALPGIRLRLGACSRRWRETPRRCAR
jgi:hypothetical protein